AAASRSRSWPWRARACSAAIAAGAASGRPGAGRRGWAPDPEGRRIDSIGPMPSIGSSVSAAAWGVIPPALPSSPPPPSSATAVASAFNAMADDLSARADALAASDRARRHLLADVSHELATPITAMRGYLETLTMPEVQLDEATKARYLAIIGDETNRLERLIGDLLDLARLEGGGGTLRFEEGPVADLFARVVERHEPAYTDARVLIATAIDDPAARRYGDR